MKIDREHLWTDWQPYPDPRNGDHLVAPIGPGVYQLRRGETLVHTGMGRCVAVAMSSLLPERWGSGTRNNNALRQFILRNIKRIEYRCIGCESENDAKKLKLSVRRNKNHIF